MSTVTRRKFLEESMIAAAVAAAARSSEPLAAAESARVSANDTIHHAVIGCRIRGRAHAAEFASQAGVEVTHVCDPDRRLADELADSVQASQGRRPRTVADLRDLLDDASLDTVSIATPNHWHALAAIWAMQAGKDVYVEKPVSHTIEEGRRIVLTARRTGRLCQAGTQRRSNGGLAAAAEYIRQGKLGEVKLARSIIYGQRDSIGALGKYPVPKEVDYNLWLGPAAWTDLTRPNLHYDWHWVWNTGNGELGNNNIHIVDVCRWLMGLTGLGKSVISIGERLGYEDAGQTPNTQMVVHDFGGPTIIQEVRGLKSDPYSDKFNAGWVVHGSEGFVAEESLFDPDGKLVSRFEGPSVNHFANFMQAVRNRRPGELNADILEGHQSSSLCHIANISHRLGRLAAPAEIEQEIAHHGLHEEALRTFSRLTSHLNAHAVDLERHRLRVGPLLRMEAGQESFVQHPAANELLGRQYRAPFVLPPESEI